jgi:hypothetical protein
VRAHALAPGTLSPINHGIGETRGLSHSAMLLCGRSRRRTGHGGVLVYEALHSVAIWLKFRCRPKDVCLHYRAFIYIYIYIYIYMLDIKMSMLILFLNLPTRTLIWTFALNCLVL